MDISSFGMDIRRPLWQMQEVAQVTGGYEADYDADYGP